VRGSGIGLAIVAAVAQGHGGDVIAGAGRPGAAPPGLRVELSWPAGAAGERDVPDDVPDDTTPGPGRPGDEQEGRR
jgi:two-component system OmpR family sensor kinase